MTDNKKYNNNVGSGEYEKNIKKYLENTNESGANSFLLPLGTKFRLLHVDEGHRHHLS